MAERPARWARTIALAATLACLAGAASSNAGLPAFNVNLAQTSVSGLSSGAYMAGQFHVAFSDTVIGAGIVAGGPYGCAEGHVSIALGRCMDTWHGRPSAQQLLRHAQELAETGEIDPLSGLTGDRVYLFSGTRDETVAPEVVAEAAEFYRLAGLSAAAIRLIDNVPADHGFVTLDRGNACGLTASPYLIDCDYDQAGMLLSHLLGPLNPPAVEPEAELIAFGQGDFLAEPTAHGMAETGYAYVPASCSAGAPCRVHVAFHGCKQGYSWVGESFVRDAGYNRWADTNGLIVLYPQAHATPLNPSACWDWWGYDDADHATRFGRQMAAVRAMLARLAGENAPFCRIHSGFNLVHWQAGRARLCAWWQFCAVGSGDVIGFAVNVSTLYESPEGHFGTAPCTP